MIVYPDGEWVTTTYNSMGLPNRLKNNQNGDLVDGLTASSSVPNGVTYDEAGRVTQMRFPLGGNLYRTQQYASFGQQDSNGGHLTSLKVGTNSNPANSDSWNHTYQNYWYDSFGNITQVDDQGAGTYSLSYDAQNRLLNSYGRSYTYDAAGRLTNYEGAGLTPSPDNPHAMAPDWYHYVLDLNGNYDARLQGSGNQAFTWTVDNHLQRVSWGYGEESYLYDADGQRIKKSNRYGDVTFYPFPNYEVTNEVAWVDDAIPGGATVVADSDGWVWDNGYPVSGASYHRSPSKAGFHQHYFYGATQPLKVNTGDALYAYVYLDPNNPPSELMFQWYDSSSGWEHRAYWGQNLIAFGTDGANSRRYMGALPSTGGWVRLEVPASQVGLEGVNVTGMAFTLYNGQAWWDRAGKRSATWLATKAYAFNGQRIALRDETGLYYLHADRLGSTMATTNGSGNTVADHGYYAYGRDRRGSELRTDRRFTGQQSDASGLIYMNARYYDPQLGQFISPDTLVPDATNVFDYNRYMYARGNPMKYTDPTGHYSDSELMTHFGCTDWACVEANFQEGGAYAGLWGWLYTLQQAVDGDTVGATFMAQNTGNAYLSGQFQRNANGKIMIHATSYVGPTGGNSLNALMPENAFANFAANGDYGLFDLQGQQASFGVGRDALHNYLSLAPGTLLLTAAKAGTSLGPVIQNAGMAACATLIGCSGGAVVSTVGKAYTLVGWSVTLANDYVLPLLTSGDWQTVRTNAGVEGAAQLADRAGTVGKRVSPYIGPAVDIINGLCYGTGCRK